MKKGFMKTVIVTALAVIIAGNMTTTAMAHHGHSSGRASQDTTGYQGGHCNDNAYCGGNERYRDDTYCGICGICHNDGYAYCDRCGTCHNDEYAYCDLCQTCHSDEYAYCDICRNCHNGGYCETYGLYPDEANYGTDDIYRDTASCEARKHHARFYCGSREEYYSRKNCRLDCY